MPRETGKGLLHLAQLPVEAWSMSSLRDTRAPGVAGRTTDQPILRLGLALLGPAAGAGELGGGGPIYNLWTFSQNDVS